MAVGKQINGVLKQSFLYQNQLQVAAELDGSNNVISSFVYGTKANVPDYLIKSGVTYRIITDHLGSSPVVINTITGARAFLGRVNDRWRETNASISGIAAQVSWLLSMWLEQLAVRVWVLREATN